MKEKKNQIKYVYIYKLYSSSSTIALTSNHALLLENHAKTSYIRGKPYTHTNI